MHTTPSRCDAALVLRTVEPKLERYWPGKVQQRLTLGAACELSIPPDVLEGLIVLIVSRTLGPGHGRGVRLDAHVMPLDASTRSTRSNGWLRIRLRFKLPPTGAAGLPRSVVPVGLVQAFEGFVKSQARSDAATLEIWLPCHTSLTPAAWAACDVPAQSPTRPITGPGARPRSSIRRAENTTPPRGG